MKNFTRSLQCRINIKKSTNPDRPSLSEYGIKLQSVFRELKLIKHDVFIAVSNIADTVSNTTES